jgi:hypothetical protein
MLNSFTVLEKASTVIFHSITLNMAAAVCDQLEDAGFPARLGKVSSGFAVMVPPEFVANSRKLLSAQPKPGERLF